METNCKIDRSVAQSVLARKILAILRSNVKSNVLGSV